MSRKYMLLLCLLFAGGALFFSLTDATVSSEEGEALIPYTLLMQDVEEGRITELTYRSGGLEGTSADGEPFRSLIPNDPQIFPQLRQHGVEVTVASPRALSPAYELLLAFGPTLLILCVIVLILRRTMRGTARSGKFGKIRAEKPSQPVTFADAAGIDEAKAELQEIVEFLKDASKFTRVGGRVPKGVLLAGPPGTGKTLLARAIAGEAGVPFFSYSGSDFVEMYVGVGAKRIRELFAEAKKKAPCLIFIDEIDAVGRQRGNGGGGGGSDEREQTLNQLLVELDGFEGKEGIILIAATNRPDILDSALLRPGRIDRQVFVPRPDVAGRRHILEVHGRNVPLGECADLAELAKGTPGSSGADLANLINEAALFAARENRDRVTMDDLDRAKDKVLMGSERRSMVISPREQRITAYHEAGHTLVSLCIPEAQPVHKVSIVPRGGALGVTQFLPDEELHNETLKGAQAAICTLLGGRVAEELAVGDITSGASDDLRRATALARKMVCEWGMCDTFGLMSLLDQGGAEEGRSVSEATARQIDAEVKKILGDAHTRTREILAQSRPALDRLAAGLVEHETLDHDEIRETVDKAEAVL